MSALIRPAIAMIALFTFVTGVLYPAAVTGIALVAFPSEAGGSLIRQGETVRGSSLIGQAFTSPAYFWGRPSATTPSYNASASSGSNLGPLNPALRKVVDERIVALRAGDPANREPIPVDLVTASGSGLDPHVSPAAAMWQAGRVAAARDLDRGAVQQLVEAHIEPRTFGILGEPRVNVLLLNLALDSLSQGK